MSNEKSSLAIGSYEKSTLDLESFSAAIAFDPATLPLTGWWRDYAGVPWAGTPSTGTSGTHSFGAIGFPFDPAVGALNGHGVAIFDGINHRLLAPIGWTAFIAASAATVIGLIKADSAVAPVAWFDDPGIIVTEPDQIFGVSFSTSGIQIGNYDGVTFDQLAVPMGTAAYHVFAFTHDGAQFRGRVDSGGFSAFPKGATLSLASETAAKAGISQVGGVCFPGTIVELMIADTVLSDASLDGIKSYFNARYGLSL